MSILDTYQQNLNISIDLEWISLILERKIYLTPLRYEGSSTEKRQTNFLFQPDLVSLTYSCPIGLLLASRLQISPTKIVEQLGYLLTLKEDNIDPETELMLHLEITSSGWLNFVLDSKFIIIWLEGSLTSIKHNILTSSIISDLGYSDLNHHSANLFAVQYIHARCCSLLCLAAREKLIVLTERTSQENIFQENIQQIGWWIEQPSAIPWSALSRSAEYDIWRQLLIVTDSWYGAGANTVDCLNWSKIAYCLSQNTTIFLRECRFLGEIKQQQPQLALARLGLIALIQYWLKRILLEKLKIAAPKSL